MGERGSRETDACSDGVQEQALKNLSAVIEASGTTLKNVVKTTVCELPFRLLLAPQSRKMY
jgi:hypothetical protein